MLILDSISYSMETLWTEVPSLWSAYSHCSASNFFTLITSSCPEVSGLLAWREIRVNIGSGNGLLTDGTNVDLLLSSEAFCGIHPRAISHQVLINLIHNICLEITLFKLDMSTARQCLKSPQSLYGTSIHPTMVTLRSWSQSWMIDSHTFRSMSISPPCPHIPQIRLFQTLTMKRQGQGYGWGQRSRSHSSPSIQPMHLIFISHQSDQPFLRYVQ